MQVKPLEITICVDGIDIIIDRLEDGTFVKPAYLQGMEREIIGISANARPAHKSGGAGFDLAVGKNEHVTINTTAPASEQAIEHAGKGTALKPACEEWILCRKPISERNIALNVLKWGTGALNIDQSRIAGDSWNRPPRTPNAIYGNGNGTNITESASNSSGRFPSHILLSHTLFCVPSGIQNKTNDYIECEYQCAENCPVRLLNEQSGVRKPGGINKTHSGFKPDYVGGNLISHINSNGYPDQGGASRYFKTFPPFYYTSKASRKERNLGCGALALTDDGRRNLNSSEWTTDNRHPDGGYPKKDLSPALQNNHPTVKSQALMRYLVGLITPSGGTVIDMFAGSGSTGVACVSLGHEYILIEKEQEYIDIINARLAYAHKSMTS